MKCLKNANQINSFRTRPCLEVSICPCKLDFRCIFYFWRKRINIIKPLEWQIWSQYSRPTLFSEIKPHVHPHKRGEKFVSKIWQIYEMLQFESNYIYMYIYIIIKDKSVFCVNDITQKTLICLSSRCKVMTAMKTYLHWLSVDPNGENFKLLFSILTYVKRN